MGKHILFALLTGLLVFGVTAAWAEEPQLTEQEILKAWGQAQTDVQEIAKGKQLLTDENLDEIDAAGRWRPADGTARTYGLLTNQGCGVVCKTRTRDRNGFSKTKGVGVIVNFSVPDAK